MGQLSLHPTTREACTPQERACTTKTKKSVYLWLEPSTRVQSKMRKHTSYFKRENLLYGIVSENLAIQMRDPGELRSGLLRRGYTQLALESERMQ